MIKGIYIWKEINGLITPGGDACWCCPNCGGGQHVYGVESMYNYSQFCPECHTELRYPWELSSPIRGE